MLVVENFLEFSFIHTVHLAADYLDQSTTGCSTSAKQQGAQGQGTTWIYIPGSDSTLNVGNSSNGTGEAWKEMNSQLEKECHFPECPPATLRSKTGAESEQLLLPSSPPRCSVVILSAESHPDP